MYDKKVFNVMINVIQTYLRTKLFGRKVYQIFFSPEDQESGVSLTKAAADVSDLPPRSRTVAKARILWLQQCLDVHSDSVCFVVSCSGQTVPTD